MKFTKEWWLAAMIRAIRTFCQVFLSFLTIGAAISDIPWGTALSIGAVAALYSLLTSIVGGIPEASTDGTLVIADSEDGSVGQWSFEVSTPLEEIENSKIIRLNVNNITNRSNSNG